MKKKLLIIWFKLLYRESLLHGSKLGMRWSRFKLYQLNKNLTTK